MPCWKGSAATQSVLRAGNDTATESGALRGGFLVIEGIDGAGKSTLCKMIGERLESEGYSTVITQEPTYDEIGSFIREDRVAGISQKAEALLFVADRAVHTERISRLVESGNIVICDRYFASTVAYQSSGLGGESVDREWLIELNRPVMITPDLTVLLDIDPRKGLARIGERGITSKFEESGYLFDVRMEFLRLAEEFGFMVVDAEEDPASIAEKVIKTLKERI
ncbi:MAG: dTMP kinase [Candidatus Methanoplasma sp.]|nr:dTMP kinase [Candidatus Methanoplasma sp.]